MKRYLVTGGAGFIGHHIVQKLVELEDVEIVLLDRLDHSGNLNRLAELQLPKRKVKFVFHDLRAPFNSQLIEQLGDFDYILHLAAATHVDRSICDPLGFVMDNVVGTCNLLDFARASCPEMFLYFSTDEVFGPAPPGVAYKEDDRYRSGNPYAATKAGAEELCVAYANTYAMPIIITHTMNVIGQRQNPEKFLPDTIAKVRDGRTVVIHADRTCKVPGSRFYIDAFDVADAVLFLLLNGRAGEKYNIVGPEEMDNLRLAECVAWAMDMPLHTQLVDFHSSRPGHDLRYALDGSKLRSMGFEIDPPDIRDIVLWYLANPQWLPRPRFPATTFRAGVKYGT
jgi:dTDP-glucose 4,6-dehydratase